MNNQILQYFGYAHADYLHAKGKQATYNLIEVMQPQQGDNILEVGFGTGATLVQMASHAKSVKLTGYELEPIMFKKGSTRIKFCGLKNKINLNLLLNKNKFPAVDNTLDKVYAESIIGIQEGDDFINLLNEIKRVLKPNGILVFNETIWLDSTSKTTAIKINEKGKQLFGIIQSNATYTHTGNWQTLLNNLGFECQLIQSVSEIKQSVSNKNLSTISLLSKLYSAIGKIKMKTNGKMRREWNAYTKEMKGLANTNQQLMDGYIFKAIVKK